MMCYMKPPCGVEVESHLQCNALQESQTRSNGVTRWERFVAVDWRVCNQTTLFQTFGSWAVCRPSLVTPEALPSVAGMIGVDEFLAPG
jgi:hypothetical protein